MVTRPAASEWRVIGLDEDPAPGDPEVVIEGGRNYQTVAISIGDAAAAVQRLSLEGWESQAVDALMEKKDEVVEEIRRAQDRYHITGGALVEDGQTLAEVQQETAAALAEASRAQTEMVAAEQ